MTESFSAAMQHTFDDLANVSEQTGVEYWSARDLQQPLGYARWENFLTAIGRAMDACVTAGALSSDHFRDVTKMIVLGKGAAREVRDVVLTRYACYLVAMNGDPRKAPIAFAQTYFATHSTQKMKDRLGIPYARPLADFLPTLTIAAKNLATEMTNHNVRENDLRGEQPIGSEHEYNNVGVREMLNERGIMPETLPAEEDIKKLERKVRGSSLASPDSTKLGS